MVFLPLFLLLSPVGLQIQPQAHDYVSVSATIKQSYAGTQPHYTAEDDLNIPEFSPVLQQPSYIPSVLLPFPDSNFWLNP